MAKQMRITVEPLNCGKLFEVVQLVNTLRASIGERVNSAEVERWMRHPALTVVVREQKGR